MRLRQGRGAVFGGSRLRVRRLPGGSPHRWRWGAVIPSACRGREGLGWPSPGSNVALWHGRCPYRSLLCCSRCLRCVVESARLGARSGAAGSAALPAPRGPCRQQAPLSRAESLRQPLGPGGSAGEGARCRMWRVLAAVWLAACRKPPKPAELPAE